MTKQGFGSVRKLPSGRYQARFTDAAGGTVNAPVTFTTKAQAQDWLVEQRADRLRGIVRDHSEAKIAFLTYARTWIDQGGSRGRLSASTSSQYVYLLERDLAAFHGYGIGAVRPADVRKWFAGRADHPTRRRQAYALLKAIYATAVRDGAVATSPCTIVGAGVASAPERPYLSPQVLSQIVDLMPPHHRVPLLTMFGGHLRLGELIGLQRGDFDESTSSLTIERQVVVVNGTTMTTPTKTQTTRRVTLPPSVAVILSEHLRTTKGFALDPMFHDRTGSSSLTRASVQQAFRKASRALGLTFHVHDVRHCGLTTAATAGATTRELMSRAGHSTARASLIYQHVAEERAGSIAQAMDAVSGTYLARGRSSLTTG